MDTVIFAPDRIEYAFLGVSLSDAKFMAGEYSNESRNEIYFNVCARQITGICANI